MLVGLVITDSRVSLSDARICVAASPYVTRRRAQRGQTLDGAAPFYERIVIYVTSRNDYEMATGRYRSVWSWGNADVSWGFRGFLRFALGRKR